jgi:hypothetical protein
MSATPHGGSGTSLTFPGFSGTITGITVNFSDVSGESDRIDISHLGLTTGAEVLTLARPLKGATSGETGKEVSFDYIGNAQLIGGTTGTLSISGGVSISGNATIVSSSVTLAVNDVIRGSATVRVA